MRILAVLTLITATFLSPMMNTKAEAQCLLCGAVGFALGSASNDEQAGASVGSNVIYVAPYIGNRIDDPLDVRIVASSNLIFTEGGWNTRTITPMAGSTLHEIFKKSVTNPEKYTIIEIMRVITPDEVRGAIFWFAYIENEKIRPLSEFSNN